MVFQKTNQKKKKEITFFEDLEIVVTYKQVVEEKMLQVEVIQSVEEDLFITFNFIKNYID